MGRISLIFLFLLGAASSLFSQKVYKEMMEDPSINFYDVCAEAERYFEAHDKDVKGSGWKGYQRWKASNEYKYYPSGDRSQVDPFFAEKAYQEFLDNHPQGARQLFPNGWEELGPLVIDSITGHYAAGLGRVEDFYVDPNNANLLYLGSRSGGFWKSTDGGGSWEGGSTDFLFASGVNAMTVSPTNPDSILVNIQNSVNGYSHGLYRSIDGGTTWNSSNFNPANVGFGGLGTNFRVYKLAYHPTIPNLVFIGTNQGLYRSDDNLQTWTRLLNSFDVSEMDFHPTDQNVVYVYDRRNNFRDNVHVSGDAGLTFTASSTIPGNSNSTGRLSVSPVCDDCLYYASNNGVWKSMDQGANFTFISNPNASTSGFAVNDQDTTNMVYGNIDLFRTTTGGQIFNQATWWSLGSGQHGAGSLSDNFFNTNVYVHADLRIAKSVNGVLYVGTDGFLCSSADKGGTWDVLSQGTGIRENYRLGTSQSNHYVSMAGSQDNGTSIKKQGQWVEFYGADGMEAIIHPLNSDWMMGSFQFGGRRRTEDGGLTQIAGEPNGQSGSGIADWLAPLTYDPNNQMRIYHFSKDIYVSEDFGLTWTLKGQPSGITGNIQRAAIAENNSDIVVISRGSSIEKSTNGGASFISIANGLPNSTVQDIAFDPNDDDVIIVVFATYQNNGDKVFLTSDGGSSWTNITNNLGNMPVRSVVIDHSNDSHIYLGAEIGIYTMPMNGSTWSLYNTDFPNTTTLELEINNGSNTLKAATWGRGLWEYALVNRANYPAILTTSINDMPTANLPAEGVDQYVTSTIVYDSALTSVFVEWSANTPIFGNAIPMTNTMDSTWVSDMPLPDYPEGTKMYFKVFAVGSLGDTTETYKFMFTVQPFSYCGATGSISTGSDYIDYVELNGVTNPSAKEFYGDFTQTYIPLIKDSTYTLQVGLNFYFAPDSALAWIDYNRNGGFESTEQIVLSQFDPFTFQAFGTFTVPSTASFGDTVVMRVRNAYATLPDPCGSAPGEVEDYSIILREILCVTSYATETTTECSGYTWPINGVSYATSGTYIDSTSNALGCDSVVTLNLTIQAVDTSVAQSGAQLTANASNASFQWIDCSNGGQAISGATGGSYTALANGAYAVVVTENGCSDTSACRVVTVVGNTDPSELVDVRLFPNPSEGQFTVDLGASGKPALVTIYTVGGKLVREPMQIRTRNLEIDLGPAQGAYWVVIRRGEAVAVLPVVVY